MGSTSDSERRRAAGHRLSPSVAGRAGEQWCARSPKWRSRRS